MNWISIALWLTGTVIVMLGPLLLIHELAHFIFAKLAGVRVEEFGFGFPPRLLGLWRGKGYLEIGSTRVEVPRAFRLPSELEDDTWIDAVARRRDDGSYVLKRLAVLDGDTDPVTPKREQVAGGVRFRGVVTEVEPGTLYSLNLLPMGAFVRMTGEEDPSDPLSLAAQPKRWRLAVMAAGPVVNIMAALLLLVGAYTTSFPTSWQVQVTQVEPGTAADQAGLQPGDRIVAADGEPIVEGLTQLRSVIRAAPEETIDLEVERNGKQMTLMAMPERREGYGFLGIAMAPWPDRSGLQRYSLPRAVAASVSDLVLVAKTTLQVPIMLIQGSISSQEARPTSMVGITQVMTFSLQQSVEWGLAFPALQTASLISLALGLTNLLPLPALDGGRILFVLIEVVRGRRVPPEKEAVVHFIGMMVLVGLMLLVMLQDVFDPIIPWSLLR
ncbi:MAG: M50 family metallopeptidase [Anaerolineae bacterium]|jgi:regulator of sigma E protease